MIPWEEIDRVEVPGTGQADEIILRRRGAEFSIRTGGIDTGGIELMNSRRHGSEYALAELACNRIKRKSGLTILIGGLGMGYTLRAALDHAKPGTRITVAELIPAVVRWNHEHLGHLAGTPLNDPRVVVQEEDVADIISRKTAAWDAMLLDVDNGPGWVTREGNGRLYSKPGLAAAFAALRPGGVLAVWSSGVNAMFSERLKRSGFQTEIVSVPARKSGKGGRHTIWLAQKRDLK